MRFDRSSPAAFRRLFFTCLILVALSLEGCAGDNLVTSDRWTWIWFLIPLLGFGLTGFILVLYRRKSQISSWDLRVTPEVPSAKSIILWTVSIAITVSSSFAIYNLLLEMDSWQKVLNVGGWFLGAIMGTTLAIYLGLRSAEPPSLPGRR
ncbi:MAG: hypothetical protein ACJ75H_11660 [Thermoanaerobaculia bacterium]